ncbi:MAG: hypothetical protein MN733_35685, partial [Nitrososphaera sp.]|nr:hypothetical protein [Nitrososphaera sp.]
SREDEVDGSHHPMQKGQPDCAFTEGDQSWISVNPRLARQPILERGSWHTALLRKLPLGNGSMSSRFKGDDLRRGSRAIPSRLFWFVLARCRIRFTHGFGSGGAVGIATTTLPEPTVLVESRSATLLTAVGRTKRQI